MHKENRNQPLTTQASDRDPVPGSRQEKEFRAVRARLLLRRLLRARRIMVVAKLTVTVTVIAAVMLSADHTYASVVQQSNTDQANQSAQQTPAELEQLVAPFALYPDALVAQILAASTYPTQIVEAERWLQNHSNLKGEELASEVDKESWDPSVKALIQFPSVLAKMNESLSWTSAVGDAYFNQQQDVLDAVQVMRKRAEDAGTLQSTPQQTVATQGSTIVIEPPDPDVCYLPVYDPWTVYGTPLAVYPGYIFDPWVGPEFYFGPGIGLGFFRGYGWGWRAWGFNWGRRQVLFNHNTYVSRSPSFFHRSPGERGNLRPAQNGPSFRGDHNFGGSDQNHLHGFTNPDSERGPVDRSHNPTVDRGRSGRPSSPGSPPPNHRDARGFGDVRSSTGTRSGAFSGFGQGGIQRGSASRGQSSFGGGGFGGGGMRGGGGGMRGGGGGGRHR